MQHNNQISFYNLIIFHFLQRILEEKASLCATKSSILESNLADLENIYATKSSLAIVKDQCATKSSLDGLKLELKRNCKWGSWSNWEPCTQNCDGGTQQRKRALLLPARFGGQCLGSEVDTQQCNTHPCISKQ